MLLTNYKCQSHEAAFLRRISLVGRIATNWWVGGGVVPLK
jgi:hypothetical protein